jgi:hypothetical protein
MTHVEALITLARRYCTDNFTYWSNRYSIERTGTDMPYTYSDSDYNLFPRYNVLLAILEGIETLVPKDFQDVEHCKQELKHIGLSAQSLFTEGEQTPIEQAAIQDERQKFVEYIDNITEADILSAEPMPYRRRLKRTEKEDVRKSLLEKWNFNGHYWDPLEDHSPQPVVFLMQRNITENDLEKILAFIKNIAGDKVFEIKEDGSDAEIEFELLDFDCHETIYCDKGFHWIVYCSHESTITFGGGGLPEFIGELFSERQEKLNRWE